MLLPYPLDPDAPAEAVCAATYYADRIPAFAFVFRVEPTNTRFTVYASTQDAYLMSTRYRLILCDPDDVALRMSSDEAQFLRHCLRLVEDRWQEAIAQADAGAARPESDRTAEPGHLNVEPSPAGYHRIGDRFRDECHRVTRLRERVDQILAELPTPDGDLS